MATRILEAQDMSKRNVAQINFTIPTEWIEAIDEVRGDVSRNEWIRERLRLCSALRPYKLEQPPGRGEWKRNSENSQD